jgi:hypothetical protein
MFASLAKFERELISERTKATCCCKRFEAARPRKMDLPTLLKWLWPINPLLPKNVAKRLNISTATLYEYVHGNGSPKEPATKLLLNRNKLLKQIFE